MFLCVALLGFVSSHFWRLHIERGQYYVYLVALLSLSWWLKVKFSGNFFLYTIPLAIATAFRPTFGVMGFVLIFFWHWRSALCYFAFVCIFVGSTLPFGGISRWQQFFANADDIARGMEDAAFLDTKFGTEKPGHLFAEGMSMDTAVDVESTNSSFGSYAYRVLWRLHVVPHSLETAESERPAQIAIGLILAAVAVPVLVFRKVHQKMSDRVPLFCCLTVALMCDLLVPVRFTYVDMLFLLPVGIILFDSKNSLVGVVPMVLVGLGLLIGSGGNSFINARDYQMLRPILIVGGCIIKALTDLALTKDAGSETIAESSQSTDAPLTVAAPLTM